MLEMLVGAVIGYWRMMEYPTNIFCGCIVGKTRRLVYTREWSTSLTLHH